MPVKRCEAQYSRFRKANRRAAKACCLLLCLLLGACANNTAQLTEKTADSLGKLQKQFDEHLTEWQALKPTVERLLKSEQDLHLLMTELDKVAALDSQPSEQQLTEQTAYTLAEKKTATEREAIAIKEPLTTKEQATEKAQAVEKEAMPLAKNSLQEEVGIHIASYTEDKNLQQGWAIYQRKYPHLLKDKKPRAQAISINGVDYQRLIIGGFTSTEAAEQICSILKKERQFCRVSSYKKP